MAKDAAVAASPSPMSVLVTPEPSVTVHSASPLRMTVESGARRSALIWGVVALALAALALAMPVNHDEGQYVGAEALAAAARPYADFAYLQTPLQLYVGAPVVALFKGYGFIALRLLNALMGAGLLGAVFATQRRLGVDRSRAAKATALLAACYIFQFSVSVARNDALPALLEGGAMLAGVAAVRDPRRAPWLWSAAGLGLALAASAKVSFVLPLGAAGLYLLWGVLARRAALSSVLGFSAAAGLGLLPCVLALASAPEAFIYGVYTFAATAPARWYRDIGLGRRLGLEARLSESVFHLAIGPALGVLLEAMVLAVQRWRARDRIPADQRFIQVLALAGLVAALTPSPVQRQYFMPLLPPLFVLWGRIDAWDRISLGPLLRRTLLVTTVIGAVVGAGRALYVLSDAFARPTHLGAPPAVRLTAEAHWIGARLRAAAVRGPVATPSPHAVIDSGYPLDPRFASGAFLYRSGDMLPEAQLRRLRAASPSTLAHLLDEAPPGAIVVGFEQPEGPARRNLDDDFRAYATSRGYRREADPPGRAEIYIRPATSGPGRGR